MATADELHHQVEELHRLCQAHQQSLLSALQEWLHSSSMADQFPLGSQEGSSASGSSDRLAGVGSRDVLMSV